MKERLQKILAARGICSRRASETYINEGRVKVNGMTALLGESADPDTDEICVDDVNINEREPFVYIVLNKPRGYVTTLSDEAGRQIVTELVTDIKERIYPVGRLDMHSEGLLIMTNDGDMAYRLTHPSHTIYKQYLVKVVPDEAKYEDPEIALSKPMLIDGHMTSPAKCRIVSKLDNGFMMTISIREGRNRQIRKMCTKAGFTVSALKRVAVGKLMLGDLKAGTYRHLTKEEIEYLKSV